LCKARVFIKMQILSYVQVIIDKCKLKESYLTISNWNGMKYVDESNYYKILQLKRNYGNHEVSRCPNQYWSQKDLDLEENLPMGAPWHVWGNTNQELLQKGFSPWTKYSKTIQKLIIFGQVIIIFKSHSVQINTDPRKTLIWKKTLPWELCDVFEKTQIKNCYRNVFLPWTKYSKTIQTLIFGHVIIIIKSHSVQINTDPRKHTWYLSFFLH